MNTVLELTAGSSWDQLSDKLSPENQQDLHQLLILMLKQIEMKAYPPKPQPEVDCQLVAEVLSHVTGPRVKEFRFCSLSDIQQNGLRVGTTLLPLDNSSSGLELAIAQSFPGRRLIDAVGEKWGSLRRHMRSGEWKLPVASFVESIQKPIRLASQQTVLKIFDPALTIGYLLTYYLHFRLAGDDNTASCLRSLLAVVERECFPWIHTDDGWTLLVA